MRRIAGLLIRLYPASWRARYGEEFLALIEDAPPRWSSLFDLLGGAVKMHFSNLTFTRLAVALSLTGLVVGFGASYLIAPRYVSQTEMSLAVAQPGAAPERSLPDMYMRLKTEVTSRTSLSAVIQDPRLDLYKAMRQTEPLEDVIESMRHEIRIEPIEHPGMSSKDWMAFTVRFGYSDPHKTQGAVQTLVTKLMEANLEDQRPRVVVEAENDRIYQLEVRIRELEKKLGMDDPSNRPAYWEKFTPHPARSGFQLSVLDSPSLPERPAFPNRAIFAASGFGSGFGLAVLATLLRRKPAPPVALPA